MNESRMRTWQLLGSKQMATCMVTLLLVRCYIYTAEITHVYHFGMDHSQQTNPRATLTSGHDRCAVQRVLNSVQRKQRIYRNPGPRRQRDLTQTFSRWLKKFFLLLQADAGLGCESHSTVQTPRLSNCLFEFGDNVADRNLYKIRHSK
jgi:hypothetical protein